MEHTSLFYVYIAYVLVGVLRTSLNGLIFCLFIWLFVFSMRNFEKNVAKVYRADIPNCDMQYSHKVMLNFLWLFLYRISLLY